MTIKMNYRMPTTAFGYVELEVSGENSRAIENDVAAMQKLFGASIQMAGAGDSAGAAERLLAEQLGAVRINEDGSPWEKPQAPVSQPWGPTPAAPPQAMLPSAGPPPFGPNVSAPPSFGPPAGGDSDVYLIEVPREKMDVWKATDRPWLQGELPRDFIAWDATAKRNTIKKAAGEQCLNWLRTNGYALR